MNVHSLGEAIRKLRTRAELSLRELAKKVDISPPFLSDIELGKRYPSEGTLHKLAKTLGVSLDHLKKYDQRESANDLKRLIERDPRIGLAFRSTVEGLKAGKITAEDLHQRLNPQK